MSKCYWVLHWAVSPTVSNRLLGDSFEPSITGSARTNPVVKVFKLFTHVVDWPPRPIFQQVSTSEKSVSDAAVLRLCGTCPGHISSYFKTFNPQTQDLTSNFRVAEALLRPYAMDTPKTIKFKFSKCSQVVCSEQPFSKIALRDQSYFSLLKSAFDRYLDVKLTMRRWWVSRTFSDCAPNLSSKDHQVRCTYPSIWISLCFLCKSKVRLQITPLTLILCTEQCENAPTAYPGHRLDFRENRVVYPSLHLEA